MSSGGDEAAINPDQSLLLLGGEFPVEADRSLDGRPIVGRGGAVEKAGARVEGLGRDLKRVGDPFQDLSRRFVKASLDLTEVRVRDLRENRQLPEREVGEPALGADELPDRLPRGLLRFNTMSLADA